MHGVDEFLKHIFKLPHLLTLSPCPGARLLLIRAMAPRCMCSNERRRQFARGVCEQDAAIL
jgi:hypothetical protein